ncbi:NAD-dependent epimerase/dehydratase family protein [Turicibacter sanguinis]|uniref:NAD-dependent epimerase/dehydratase family protein n=1 Tax=Turicibacter sanguinis TaxID=154288 RepID=UPI0018ABEFB7|nr:NAD-dependent epimerase/dehydratase family protein [Turicibacter sanguinis]
MNIFIAGIDGMIGAECKRILQEDYTIIGSTYESLDLMNYNDVYSFMKNKKIDIVVMAAAKVGGGHAIQKEPISFLEDNLLMQINLMKASRELKIKKFIFIASAAVYPAKILNPICEEDLLKGALDNVQESYGLAKIVGIKQTEYSNLQFGTKYVTVIPANVIANRDNGQVIYSLLKQMNEAKKNNQPSITLWGSGQQRREFIFIEDVAKAIKVIIQNYERLEHSIFNLGVQEDISISELAQMIKRITNYKGEIAFDTTKPEGVYQRLLNSDRIFNLGFKPSTNLESAIVQIQKQFES